MKSVCLGIVILMLATMSAAKPLSDAAFFHRCYAQLTGNAVPYRHPTMQLIRQGKQDALTACRQLIDKATLNSSTGYLNFLPDLEARAILNNLNVFHRSWFPANTVEQIQDYSQEFGIGTIDIYDSTEPGLAITRALLQEHARYEDVLKLNVGVAALRQIDNKKNIYPVSRVPGRRMYGDNLPGFNANIFNFRGLTGAFNDSSDLSASIFQYVPPVEVGELVGIRLRLESYSVPNLELAPRAASRRGNEQAGLNYSFDLYRNFGGGVIGSPIYLMLNFGHGRGVSSNGTTKVPRRWAQVSMSSLLCTELPTLRESDIRSLVDTKSSTPFRVSANCVRCHATMDQMAYVARNMTIGSTDWGPLGLGTGPNRWAKMSLLITDYRQDFPSAAGWASEPVVNFHRQHSSGKLFFRSSTGKLIDRNVANISELAREMSETDDFYTCAAKRYFEFMTGIRVPLYDRSNPENANLNLKLTPDAIKDRAFVESLGKELRQTQSLRQLVKSILGSSYYRDANFRPSN